VRAQEAYVDEIVVGLLDDAFQVWRAAATECERALRGWDEDAPRGGAAAFWCYTAALEREEAAARDLQRLYATVPCRERVGGAQEEAA
jgi:hypothetical protein